MPAGHIRPTVSPALRYIGFRLICGELFKIKKPEPDNTDFVNDRLFMPLHLDVYKRQHASLFFGQNVKAQHTEIDHTIHFKTPAK